jgi:hypothetical protein
MDPEFYFNGKAEGFFMKTSNIGWGRSRNTRKIQQKL